MLAGEKIMVKYPTGSLSNYTSDQTDLFKLKNNHQKTSLKTL